MEPAFDLIVLVVVVTAVGGLARRWDLPAPLLLLGVGLLGSLVGRYDDVHLDHDVVLVGLLPPLLYSAATRTSLIDFRSSGPAIASLSVGLVIATTVAVGYLTWWLLPVPLAAGMALGAVVAPPDAVAATAIARRVGMPRRIVTLLEGESLVNDATALVCLTAAVAALEGGITATEISRDFAVSVAGGLLAGLVVAVVVGKVRMHVTDTVTQTAISFGTPFAAYLLAEEVHASGVLAVVVAGLLLGHKAAVLQSAASRLFERSNWSTITFLLEGSVFVLIGLQVRPIVEAVGDSPLTVGRIAGAALAVLLAAVALRFAWVYATTGALRRRDPGVPWAAATVVSWAGMRGVVTLAAAFVLPEGTPERDVLVLLALVVTGGTLLLQGASLPALIRRTSMAPPDHHEDALLAADVVQRAARAGRDRLEAELAAGAPGATDAVVDRLRRRGDERAEAMWERLGGEAETPSQAYARLRTAMLDAERAEVLRIRDTGTVPHEVLQEVLAALDVEESVLELLPSTSTAEREVDLAVAAATDGCDHLADAALHPAPPPTTPEGCEECLREGSTWVHLRLCLTCGHVGCCDSSPGRHATAHHAATGHPVIRSFELGEAWRWCFLDEQLG